jgi:hypothetical protein
LGFLGLGFALAAWWFAGARPGASTDQGETPVELPGVAGLAVNIDWGDLKDDFKIRNARAVMKSDSRMSRKPFPVIAFDVEALDECPGRMYMAKFYDADGVELGPVIGADGFAKQRTLGLVTLEPDYAVQEPWRWLPGVRSHGWFLLPDHLDNEELPKPQKIVISYMRF